MQFTGDPFGQALTCTSGRCSVDLIHGHFFLMAKEKLPRLPREPVLLGKIMLSELVKFLLYLAEKIKKRERKVKSGSTKAVSSCGLRGCFCRSTFFPSNAWNPEVQEFSPVKGLVPELCFLSAFPSFSCLSPENLPCCSS